MRNVLRSLLNTASDSASGLSDTTTKNVPTAPPASSTSHRSTTSLFIIYMVIGFSVTFACILVLMVIYHCCRRTWPPLIAVAARPTQQSSSSQGGHSGHELKQLFVVQHPGGSANLAFRENEELKPYKKKSGAVLLSASLEDACFTIPAWKANVDDPENSQVIRPAHETQNGEDCADVMLDDTSSMTDSMLTASSDIILAHVDSVDDVSELEQQSSQYPSDTVGQSSPR